LTVPGFDLANSILVPVWSGVDDIFLFAQEFLLYFCLQEKLNFHFNDCRRSNIFLWAIQSSEFADTATVLQTQINLFRFEYDDGFLPPHLHLHGLATSIHQNTQAYLTGIARPRTHMVTGNLLQIQGLLTSFKISRGDLPPRDNYPGRSRDSGGRFGDGFVGDDNHGNVGWVQDHGPPRGHGRPPNSGWLARPDRNRRPFLEGVQCAACGRVGHVAKQCDMLATASCLEHYMKKDLSASLRDAIEQEWVAKWKERLGNPSSTPFRRSSTSILMIVDGVTSSFRPSNLLSLPILPLSFRHRSTCSALNMTMGSSHLTFVCMAWPQASTRIPRLASPVLLAPALTW
jgi:hypothetical protein